jgi:hypothetical protein
VKNKMKETKSEYFTWHLDFWWSWHCLKTPFEREFLLDGGSVEWRIGPFIIQKKIHCA